MAKYIECEAVIELIEYKGFDLGLDLRYFEDNDKMVELVEAIPAADVVPRSEACPYYVHNEHDRGNDSICRKAGCEAEAVRPVVQREAVMQALNKYFSIGDSDTYQLTRVKEAFHVGTMTLNDFEEWNEDNVSDLCDYLMKELFCPNCGTRMGGDADA